LAIKPLWLLLVFLAVVLYRATIWRASVWVLVWAVVSFFTAESSYVIHLCMGCGCDLGSAHAGASFRVLLTDVLTGQLRVKDILSRFVMA
jgi:hypothetical protein